MAKRGERKCIMCGKTYIYCPNCGKGDPNETFHYLFDTKECMEVNNILSRYTEGKVNKQLTKGALNVYDVQKMKFVPLVQAIVDEIFKADKKVKPVVDDVDE